LTSFTLAENKLNTKIAEALKEKNKQYVKTAIREGRIEVTFAEGLIIHRSDIDILTDIDLTDEEWNTLAKEIKETLKGARMFHNKKTIEIVPLKTRMICIRFNPIDMEIIKDAAKDEKRTISDFIRVAAIERAQEIFKKETVERMEKRAREEERKTRTYVG